MECKKCGNKDQYIYEAGYSLAERTIRRLYIIIIALILALIATIGIFMWYNAQFDYESYTQDGEGINNVNIGAQGDVINEPKSACTEIEKQKTSKGYKNKETEKEVND